MRTTRRSFLAASGAAAGGYAIGAAAGQEGAVVEMKSSDGAQIFDPIGLHVEPGTTVTFENVSGSHNTVSYEGRIPDGADHWETTVGQDGEVPLEVEGTYDYYCLPHKSLGMVGRIVVGEPGGPAEGSMPPDGDVPASDDIVDAGAISYDDFTSGGAQPEFNTTNLAIGAGVLGGLTFLSVIVYYLANSEGEPYRVGSGEWRRRFKLK